MITKFDDNGPCIKMFLFGRFPIYFEMKLTKKVAKNREPCALAPNQLILRLFVLKCVRFVVYSVTR